MTDAETRTKLIAEFERCIAEHVPCEPMHMMVAVALLKTQEPVIRCRDCKHRPTDDSSERSVGGFDINFPDYVCPCQCDDGYYSWCPDDDWFCANGERRESE